MQDQRAREEADSDSLNSQWAQYVLRRRAEAVTERAILSKRQSVVARAQAEARLCTVVC